MARRERPVIPDVLGPGMRVLFVGINPGRVSAAAGAQFANPRNCFWRALHAAGFTPRLLAPTEQHLLSRHGCGLTNAVARPTRGSGDLRAADFHGALERLVALVATYTPSHVAFVGKDAYAPLFRPRPRVEHGPQPTLLGSAVAWVLPSTSPANAVLTEAEKIAWFVRLNRAVTKGRTPATPPRP